MVVDVTLTLMVVDVTLTLMVVDVTLTLMVVDITLTLVVVDVTLTLMVVDLDVTLTLMVVDVSLSNLDFSSTRMTCHVQEPISISIQYIQMFSWLVAELIQYSCPSLSSGLSMNCNRNIY